MYSYEKFYDHFCIKEDNKMIAHVDTEAEAKKIIFELNSENVDTDVETIKNIGKNYTVYHLHTMYSLLDSTTSFEDYVDMAKSYGMTAIGCSEHGNIYGWYKKKMYAEKNGLKFLFGIECYLTETFNEKIRDNYHTILIAKNKDGMHEICRLFFNSTNKQHTYYKPRLSFDEFLSISNNVIKISACIQSPLSKYMLKIKDNHTEEQKQMIIKLLKHYDYYEIQYHNALWQIEYNRYLYTMSKKFHKPLIVGTDTHSLNDYKAECRTILQYGKTDGAWGDEENDCDLTFKSYSELVEMFKIQNSLPMDVVLDAIENTNKMANSVEEITFNTDSKYPLLYGEDDEKMLWKTLKEKYNEKVERGEIDKNDKRYISAIKEEMSVFKKINMIGFMLFMSQIGSWAKENHIAMGFARGSCAGSTVAYISDIIDVDPIKWNTVFSRFANVNRVEEGDIDTDWYEDDRPKVYNYIINRFGTQNTAYILALGTLADKSVIDVIGKAFRIKAQKNGTTTPYTLDKIAEIKKEYDEDKEATREKYKDLFYYYDGLVGCITSQSQHPAGILVSPINLIDNVGAFYGSDGQVIVPLDMEECHELGLVKFDILGLKSVGVIDKTYKMIGKHFPKAYEVDWNDKAVFEDIAKDSTMIFQFESQFAHDSIKKMQPRSVEDLSLCSACLRPSGESYRDAVFSHEVHKNPSKLIDSILDNSNGFLVYQEQTIAFLQQVCGFSGSDADSIRRCVGENTLITMANGKRKPIKDIKIGEQVMTLNEDNGVFTYNMVNKVYDNGIQDVIEISTKHEHSIKMTKHHKVLTQRGWIEAGELTIDDYMMLPLRNHGYQDKKRPNERLSSTDMFLIGMLLGDGTIGGKKSDLHFTNSDISLIEKFKDCVNKRLRGNRKSEFKIVTQKGVTVENIYTIRIASKNFRNSVWDNLICNNGINCKSANKHISGDLMNYPCGEKLSNLLGGLFSTDGGYIADAKCFEYYTTSKELAYDIQFLLGKYNIYSYVYSKSVKGYNCTSYAVRISQKDAVDNFAKEIIPFVCGNKYNEFMQIINDRQHKLNQIDTRYNYLLPRIYLDEIRQNADFKRISMRSMGFDGGTNYSSFSDVKIKKVLNYLYVPKTYKLLMSEYMPIKITSIKTCGQSHVYDLEIDTNHNYIAEGLIVHNCIAKKQQDKINEALPKILDGYCNLSDKPREVAEEEAKDFIQVISDASGYSFGYNHSISYAMLSYLMGWLRYYYPTEFCTAYLNCAKNDEDLYNGTILAKSKGCKIINPKFGFSSSEYGCDSSTKSIYKGLASIKNIGKDVGDKLYDIKDMHFDNFIDLLAVIDSNKICNSRELTILILINFFEQFGNPNYLLKVVEIYNKFGKCTVLKKEKLTQEEKQIVHNHANKETTKQFRDLDNNAIMYDMIQLYKDITTKFYEQIQYDIKYLGYTNIVRDTAKPNLCCVEALEINKYGTPYGTFYNIKTGVSKTIKIDKKWYNEVCNELNDELTVGSLVEIACRNKPKRRKQIDNNGKGHWVEDGVETIVTAFKIVY